MNSNFDYLFHYLGKEDISFDKSEFIFQIQSHPDHRSLLAISDTLTFFNIDNGAIRVKFSELELLPNRFITLLNIANNNPELCFIEKKESNYFITRENQTNKINLSDLEKNWSDLVLLVETQNFEPKASNYNWISWISPTLFCLGLVSTLLQFKLNLYSSLFFIFPVVGILLSIAALKDLFGAKSDLINNFCNITASTSCESIVNSEKWTKFNFLNFSDLAVLFFTSQILGLVIFLISGNSSDFFAIQSILLIGSIPVILLSLYFQKFVEKKWCPICLLIVAVIIIEMIYLFSSLNFFLYFKSFVLFGVVFLFTSMTWIKLKKLLVERKKLKENELKLNRFVRNFEIFKNNLISKGKIELPTTPIILGNRESKTIITIITNPFCSHCKEVHEVIERILNRHDDLQISLVLKVDLENCDAEVKLFFRILMTVYLNEGQKSFRENLNSWYASNDLQNWLKIHKSGQLDLLKIDEIYNTQNNQCSQLGYNFTPIIFINGFQYPNFYERNNLEFFINEIIEDENNLI